MKCIHLKKHTESELFTAEAIGTRRLPLKAVTFYNSTERVWPKTLNTFNQLEVHIMAVLEEPFSYSRPRRHVLVHWVLKNNATL